MNASKLTINAGAAVIAATILMIAGGTGTWLLMRDSDGDGSQPAVNATASAPAAPAAPSMPAGDTPLTDVAVTLSEDAIKRSGIVVSVVTSGSQGAERRLPGIVEPNAYRQVEVTPLAAGRVTNVAVALGAQVRRGQTLAQIYSPELAEAQTRYVSARATLEAHERELTRTEKLAAIGAASRQELERIQAEHAAQSAAVQSARTQLELLGVSATTLNDSPARLTATINVPAPIAGVITERIANLGLNVDASTKLFTVVDLSTVWVVADVFEKDFSHVRVGADTRITTSAYPEKVLRGRIAYIDPQVDPDTRTAKVRVEVDNPRAELRLGMYADVSVVSAATNARPMIPRTAVQNVGDRAVVYVADAVKPGTFLEREVRLGAASGESIAVESGLNAGDTVVTTGSFFVRAERDRLGLRPFTPRVTASTEQTAKIVVNEKGFDPATIPLRAGIPARLTFLRTIEQTCATEVFFPLLNLRRQLPLNQPIEIAFTPPKSGEVGFACGMNMLKGAILVQP